MEQQHDKGFRGILSKGRIFAELLKSFIKEPWTERIDPEDLELVKTSFILPTFEKREADLIYKLKTPSMNPEGYVYFYCLMELQSQVDHSMPVRLLVYMVSFWMELLKNIPSEVQNRQDFRLPVIIPLVLYNGEAPWRVPRDFTSMYWGDIGVLKDYLVNFRYYLIDVNRYTQEDLLDLQNVIAAVFLVDQKGASEHTEEYVREVNRKLQTATRILENLSVQDIAIFLQWMWGIVIERMPKDESVLKSLIGKYLNDLKEGTDPKMFVSNFEEELGNAMRQYNENMTLLSFTTEKLGITTEKLGITTEKLSITEEKLALMEQEKAQAAEKLTLAEQTMRQAVLALKEMGLSMEAISRKLGRSQEEIENMI
jgi:hypothetical protein